MFDWEVDVSNEGMLNAVTLAFVSAMAGAILAIILCMAVINL